MGILLTGPGWNESPDITRNSGAMSVLTFDCRTFAQCRHPESSKRTLTPRSWSPNSRMKNMWHCETRKKMQASDSTQPASLSIDLPAASASPTPHQRCPGLTGMVLWGVSISSCSTSYIRHANAQQPQHTSLNIFKRIKERWKEAERRRLVRIFAVYSLSDQMCCTLTWSQPRPTTKLQNDCMPELNWTPYHQAHSQPPYCRRWGPLQWASPLAASLYKLLSDAIVS
jgi:hypothetical protein